MFYIQTLILFRYCTIYYNERTENLKLKNCDNEFCTNIHVYFINCAINFYRRYVSVSLSSH